MLTTRATCLLAALAALGLAATALAGVTVYKNDLSSKREANELRHAEGKHCQKTWRRKARNLRVNVKKGPDVCGYRPPVEGDTAGPDHDFQAKMKLLKSTPKGVRDGAYLAVAVRSGKNSGYELRVFPTKHKFELLRSPSGGGSGFPAKGSNEAVNGVNKPNVLRLKAVNAKVIARVNGTRVARVTDSNPAQVDGRKLEIAVGHRRHVAKPVSATVDDLKLQVPKP
ncbi:MAG TPA: hypothetical protein VKG89_04720 [Solirubrobacterales bacterium]|nr:hypothetical protein [Solirubrobacterales bacterium]